MRRVLGLVGLVLVAACSGSAKPAAAPTATPPPTASPSATPAATVPTASPSPTAKHLSAAQLRATLLRLSDMPSGWTTEDPGPNRDVSKTTFCGKRSDGVPYVREQAGYSESGSGPVMFETLREYATSATLLRHMDRSQAAAAACTHFSSQGTDFTIKPLSFESLGDRTFAIRLDSSVSESLDTFVAVGPVMVQVTCGGTTVDAELCISLTRKAVMAVQTVVGTA